MFSDPHILFSIDPSPLAAALLGVALIASLWLLLGLRRMAVRVSGRVEADAAAPVPDDPTAYPPASVIVYSDSDASNLEVLLPQILGQDYPAPFEVIVVNDGGDPATRSVIAALEREHPNLYMTFTPGKSRSLSRKKLAVTLGIKAAKYSVTLHTTGNCQIPSDKWLRSMCRHFGPSTAVVLGYAAPAYLDDTPCPRPRLHAFDQVRSSLEWLSWALGGTPYRGTACNLAYRRELFFSNRGFSRSLELKWGDDDVYVSEVATRANTAVELSPASMVLDVHTAPAQMHRAEKTRRDYTSGRLRGHARLFFSSCSWAWWGLTLAAAGAGTAGWPSAVPAIASAVIFLTTALMLCTAWRRLSRSLWSRPLLLTVPWFMWTHPLYTLLYRWRGWRTRKSNLCWS